ncbi:MAG: hypothetical protein ABSA31_01215 [Acidimicrobiales bacterium]
MRAPRLPVIGGTGIISSACAARALEVGAGGIMGGTTPIRVRGGVDARFDALRYQLVATGGRPGT